MHYSNTICPSRSSLVSTIKCCASRKSLSQAKRVHAYVIIQGFLPDIQFYNHLMNMYFKCFDRFSAHKLLNEMPERNFVSFSIATHGFSRSDSPQLALSFLPLLHHKGFTMNQLVLSNLVSACARLKWFHVGKQIHSHMIVSDFESDLVVRTDLVQMYSQSGDLDSAVSVFNLNPSKDSVMCNSMLSGFVRCSLYEDALNLFVEMRKGIQFKPTDFTLSSTIKACSNLSRTSGEQVHGIVIKTGFDSDIFVATSLVNMYGRFSDVQSSKLVFQTIKYADLALFNSLIVALSNNCEYKSVIELFIEFNRQRFCPNGTTFSTIVKACGALKCLRFGKAAHGVLIKSEFNDLIASTALMDMYLKCESINEGFKIFNLLPTRNTITYNAMISGLGQCGYCEQSLELYISMIQDGVSPDLSTFVSLMNFSHGHEKGFYTHAIKHGFEHDLNVQNAFLDSLIKGRFVNDARWLFSIMQEKDVVSWTSLISGLSELKMEHESLELFKKLIKFSDGVSPNAFTFSCVLKACANSNNLEGGRCIQGHAIKNGITNNSYMISSILDMYAGCGSFKDAYKHFDEIPRRDVVLWNTMITACRHHGKGREALELFQRMENYGVKPNGITFTSLLSACSHCGLINEGVEIFESISQKHDRVPNMEHYACMVDLFGRGMMLERAKSLIENMPYKADLSIWKTFLACCKLDENLGLAKFACEQILKLEGGDDNGSLGLLCNVYSEFGKWGDVEKMKEKMKDQGGKLAGLSWMQIRNCEQ